ncbi:MAG: hypothetical protein K2M80_02505 [Muribaculaceae bacterium]|nr:hypothetical protein [Muribaculaceae bacterium]
MKQTVIRYACFIAGLLLLGIGVDMIVTSALGTTPISSVNYVLSLNLPLTLGTATFVFNLVIIALQFWLIRGGVGTKKDRIEILLQIPFSVLFSLFIDLNMLWVSKIPTPNYGVQVALLLGGCIVQATGVVLELKPNVAIMSAEGMVKYLCKRYHLNFGKTKIKFDITLVVTAVLLSLIMARKIDGVREGTLVAALLTGVLVNWIAAHIATRRNVRRIKKIYHYPLHFFGLKK